MENKIYVKNRLTIKSKDHNWLYKYTYNPYLVNFHQENSDYNGNLTFDKQFNDLSIQFYNMYIKNILSLTNELNNVNKYTFLGCDSDAQYVDFTYYDNTLIYQFVTETFYPKKWYEFIKLKYPELDFSLEYIYNFEDIEFNKEKKCCFYFTNKIENNIYENFNENHPNYTIIN